MINDNQIVICGVPTSGKTTLINRLTDYDDSALIKLLNLNRNTEFNCLNAYELSARPEQFTGNIILHYDIVDRFNNGEFDFLSEFKEKFDKPLFVVLSCSKKVMFSRIRNRYLKRLKFTICHMLFKSNRKKILTKNFPRSYFEISSMTEKNELYFNKFISSLHKKKLGYIILDSSDYHYRVINDLR